MDNSVVIAWIRCKYSLILLLIYVKQLMRVSQQFSS
uniref:Uncharacterized protein n=1 Tax=Schistosoma haematobium TaxID=6185 RepID=A0A095B0H7_SCHHA